MTRVALRPWDPARGLDTDEERAEFLEAALEEDHAETIVAILGHIARSKSLEQEAVAAGLPAEALVVGQRLTQLPDLATLLAIIKVLGLRLHAGILQESAAEVAGQSEQT